MYNIVNLILQGLIAVGTIGAVIASLYYSRKPYKERRKLNIYRTFTSHYNADKPYISLVITVENTGNVPVVLAQKGRTDGKHKNVIYENDMNEYLVADKGFIMIKPNEAEIIEYRKVFDDEIQFGTAEIIKESSHYKFLQNAIFYAKDTLGNYYPAELYKNLKNEYKED